MTTCAISSSSAAAAAADGIVRHQRETVLGSPDVIGEVEDRPATAHPEGGLIVRPRRLDGGVERPEPDPGPPAAGVPDLRCELPPAPLPDATVPPADGQIIRGRQRLPPALGWLSDVRTRRRGGVGRGRV